MTIPLAVVASSATMIGPERRMHGATVRNTWDGAALAERSVPGVRPNHVSE
jgi:hypothetical protein